MRLAYKGIGLVAILVGFELIFIGCMAYLLVGAEQSARKESHYKEIVGQTSKLLQEMYDTGNMADLLLKRYDVDARKQYDLQVEDIRKDTARLKVLVADQPRYEKTATDIDQAGAKGFTILGRLIDAKASSASEALRLALEYRTELSALKKQVLSDLRGLMEAQEALVAEQPAIQAKSRQHLKTVLLIGFIANVILAFVIALMFVRTITSRVSRLVTNTRRLAEGKEVIPPVPGKDEIAQLDQAFYDMAVSLEEAQRQKQEMVQMISHDLRTPLTSVGSFLEMLKENTYGELSDRGAKRCDGASRNVRRLIDLIGNLLDIERMEAGGMNLSRTDFPVEAILNQAVDSIRDIADKANLQIEVISADLEVSGDLKLLTRVVTNFLSNAVKYSPEGSQITLKAENINGRIQVSVTDEGVGIPADALPFVFERFKQVQSDGKQKSGSGLGLAICKSIVEAHDGAVGVTSEEGKGSTFWFNLPAPKTASIGS